VTDPPSTNTSSNASPDASPNTVEVATIGFVGLGNVGAKLAGSVLRNGFELHVVDLDRELVEDFVGRGAIAASTPRALAEACDVVITCLPSPAASALVVEGTDGLLDGFGPGSIWLEMSTTDEAEIKRLGARVAALGAEPVDCPVSGGCHRAATGNISIFAGCARPTFERVLPLLSVLGRRVLHTGELGTASVLKVATNYLATAYLVAVTEALTTMAAAGIDLATTFEAFRISSGNSFVHETESQVILNGSRDISFTMDLVLKDIGLFQSIADRVGVPLEMNPLMIDIFSDAADRYGDREWSPNVIRRLEDATGVSVTAPGFPAELFDDEPEEPGGEIAVRR